MVYKFRGKSYKSQKALEEAFGVKQSTISKRLRTGWTLGQALEFEEHEYVVIFSKSRVLIFAAMPPIVRKSLALNPFYIMGVPANADAKMIRAKKDKFDKMLKLQANTFMRSPFDIEGLQLPDRSLETFNRLSKEKLDPEYRWLCFLNQSESSVLLTMAYENTPEEGFSYDNALACVYNALITDPYYKLPNKWNALFALLSRIIDKKEAMADAAVEARVPADELASDPAIQEMAKQTPAERAENALLSLMDGYISALSYKDQLQFLGLFADVDDAEQKDKPEESAREHFLTLIDDNLATEVHNRKVQVRKKIDEIANIEYYSREWLDKAVDTFKDVCNDKCLGTFDNVAEKLAKKGRDSSKNVLKALRKELFSSMEKLKKTDLRQSVLECGEIFRPYCNKEECTKLDDIINENVVDLRSPLSDLFESLRRSYAGNQVNSYMFDEDDDEEFEDDIVEYSQFAKGDPLIELLRQLMESEKKAANAQSAATAASASTANSSQAKSNSQGNKNTNNNNNNNSKKKKKKKKKK